MIKPRLSAAMLILTLAMSVALPAAYAGQHSSGSGAKRLQLAQKNGNQGERSKGGQPSEERISRDEAAAIARDVTDGRVLKVELKGNTYHVKVLLDGERIRTVRVDARTGQVRR